MALTTWIQPPYLAAIDQEKWPTIAAIRVPKNNLIRNLTSATAARHFAQVCRLAGIEISLNPTGPAAVIIEHEELFDRLAADGWLGLAEAYAAGEWDSPDLPLVLEKLLRIGYRPRHSAKVPPQPAATVIPALLTRFSSSDGVSSFAGIYSTGVATTVRQQVPSFRRGQRTAWANVTTIDAPSDIEVADLQAGQDRAIALLLAATEAARGIDLVEYPSSGGRLALAAARKGIGIDVISFNHQASNALRAFWQGKRNASAINLVATDGFIPSKLPVGRYDAVVAIEQLELAGGVKQQIEFAKTIEALLGRHGRAAIQTTVATDRFSALYQDALSCWRAYLQPGLAYRNLTEIRKIFEQYTTLQVTAEVHCNQHFAVSAKFQRELFFRNFDQAAAAGVEKTMRRLWYYSLALKEALFRLDALGGVQLTLERRP